MFQLLMNKNVIMKYSIIIEWYEYTLSRFSCTQYAPEICTLAHLYQLTENW